MNFVPNNTNDLIGRDDDISKIKSWIMDFHKEENENKNALFIEGVSGIGKTILIDLILEELKYDIYKVNGLEFKNIRVFHSHCENIMHTKNVLMMLDINIKKDYHTHVLHFQMICSVSCHHF